MIQCDIRLSRKSLKSISGLEQFFDDLRVPKKAAVFVNERTLNKILNGIVDAADDKDKALTKFLKEVKKYKIVVLNKVKRNTLTVVS